MSANSNGRNLQAKPVGSSQKGQGSLTEAPVTSTTNRFEALSLEEDMDAGIADNGSQLTFRPRTRQSRWGSDESLPDVPPPAPRAPPAPPAPSASTAQQASITAQEQLAAYLSIREDSFPRSSRSLPTAAASPQPNAMPTGTRVAGTAPSLQQAGQTASPIARPSGVLMGGTAPSLQHGPTYSGQILTDSHSPNHLPSQGGVVAAQQTPLESPEVQIWRAMGCPDCNICKKRHPPPHIEDITQQALEKAAKKQKRKDERIAAHAATAEKRKHGSKLSLTNKKYSTDETPPPATSGTYGARAWPTLTTSQTALSAAAFPGHGTTHPPQLPQPIVHGAAISGQWMELIPRFYALLPPQQQMQFMIAMFHGTTNELMNSPTGSNIVQSLNRARAEATGSGSQTTGRPETTSEQPDNAYTSEGHRSEDMGGKRPRRE